MTASGRTFVDDVATGVAFENMVAGMFAHSGKLVRGATDREQIRGIDLVDVVGGKTYQVKADLAAAKYNNTFIEVWSVIREVRGWIDRIEADYLLHIFPHLGEMFVFRAQQAKAAVQVWDTFDKYPRGKRDNGWKDTEKYGEGLLIPQEVWRRLAVKVVPIGDWLKKLEAGEYGKIKKDKGGGTEGGR